MSILSSLLRHADPVAPDAPRAVLIGTPSTLRAMRKTLREAASPMRLVGCAMLKTQHRAGAIGLPVLGTVEQLDLIVRVHRVDTALISLPLAMGRAIDRVTARLNEMGVSIRHLPTLEDQLAGRVGRSSAELDAAVLLDRKPHRLDEQAIRDTLTGKRVLITGAGGSIGSEIARLVAGYGPAALLLAERAENNLFNIDRQIASRWPNVPRRALLHDVCDEARTRRLIEQLKPHVVFHAAAHKHVPMMEDHPRAALENNFFGTRSIADAAAAAGAERFVMISTDKAVNPTSVMGATKRAAELYVQHLNGRSATDFTMVRFGNVLGSACSVIPIWAEQLAEGGPVTVTDPRMTRYFMTIPEAAALVIQAGSLPGVGGQVMLLDMGEPIRILDLAERFVNLHGLEAGRDVDLVLTGARPGEKLFEELAYDSEDVQPTAHEAVRIWKTTAPDAGRIERMVESFAALRYCDERGPILNALRQAVPEMRPLMARPAGQGRADPTGAGVRETSCHHACPPPRSAALTA